MTKTSIAVHLVGSIEDKICVIRVTGSLGAESVGRFEKTLNIAFSRGLYKIIVDLTEVDYITSAGWGVFIGELKGVREKGGDIKLCGMQPDVYEIFQLLELDHFIQAFDTVEEAEKGFKEVIPVVSTEEEEVKPKVEVNKMEREKPALKIVRGRMQELKYSSEIVKVVKAYPQYGPTLIMRELNSAKYGFIKISCSTVYRRLKGMDLNTRDKR